MSSFFMETKMTVFKNYIVGAGEVAHSEQGFWLRLQRTCTSVVANTCRSSSSSGPDMKSFILPNPHCLETF